MKSQPIYHHCSFYLIVCFRMRCCCIKFNQESHCLLQILLLPILVAYMVAIIVVVLYVD